MVPFLGASECAPFCVIARSESDVATLDHAKGKGCFAFARNDTFRFLSSRNGNGVGLALGRIDLN